MEIMIITKIEKNPYGEDVADKTMAIFENILK